MHAEDEWDAEPKHSSMLAVERKAHGDEELDNKEEVPVVDFMRGWSSSLTPPVGPAGPVAASSEEPVSHFEVEGVVARDVEGLLHGYAEASCFPSTPYFGVPRFHPLLVNLLMNALGQISVMVNHLMLGNKRICMRARVSHTSKHIIASTNHKPLHRTGTRNSTVPCYL